MFLFYFVFFFNWIQQALNKEQIDEMVKKLLEECATKEGASADDVANTIAHKMPSTKSEKCLHACIGETLGLVWTETQWKQFLFLFVKPGE